MKVGQGAGIRAGVGLPVIPTTCQGRGIEPAKGDRVEMVVDAGDTTCTYEVMASRAGRRMETAVRRDGMEVSEVTLPHARLPTRGGTLIGPMVRTARLMANGGV